MKIEIFGGGCKNCDELYQLVGRVVGEKGGDREIAKVSDMKEIVKRGIMRTPALAVDGKVVCAGRVPKYEKVVGWIVK
jgi:small redox-active disulfide protein 2